MDKKMNGSMKMQSFSDTCMKSAGWFFESVIRQVNDQFEKTTEDNRENTDAERMEFILRNWRKLSTHGEFDKTFTDFFNGEGDLPDVFFKMTQDVMENTIAVQQDILQCVGRVARAAQDYDSKETDSSLFHLWNTVYDQEISRFFKIPQIGMMRTYQEKIARVMDKYNRFQSNVAEFTRLLGMPFKKSQKAITEILNVSENGGDASEKAHTCYKKWVKDLEENFMSLFQSTEYITTLSMTMSALADFIAVRDDAIEDILKFFPVARKSDMDDMARELYELKKRLRKLEMATALKITS